MHYICCKTEIKRMNYLDFRRQFFDLGCFNIHQIHAWDAGFDRNNLFRWTKKGLLLRLRAGYYTFPEYLHQPGFAQYVAGRIYRPSYISLHSALSFYGIIPESVVQITSVSSLKTAAFKNAFGDFSYRNVKEELMFGYEPKTTADGRTFLLATPEKALLDLLYLYPFYNDDVAMEDLRLDEAFMQDEWDAERTGDYLNRFGSKALDRRMTLLMNRYAL